MSEEAPAPSAIQNLEKAIQEWVEYLYPGQGRHVDSAVVCYETIRFGEDGSIYRRVDYTIPTLERSSMAASVGLLDLISSKVSADILEGQEDEDDEGEIGD